MTMVDPTTAPLTSPEMRARWRTLAGLDCPAPSIRDVEASRALPRTAPWAATTVASPSRIRI